VSEHSSDDPRTVLVNISTNVFNAFYTHRLLCLAPNKNLAPNKRLKLLAHSKIRPKSSSLVMTSFICDGKLEREYWVSVDVPKLPNPLKAGQMSLQQDQSLCVEHVQYNGKLAESSAISRVSIRPTRSMELRSHLDKCVPCRSCKQRQDCKQCQRCRSIKQLCSPCKSASAGRCPKCWGLCDECKACRRPYSDKPSWLVRDVGNAQTVRT